MGPRPRLALLLKWANRTVARSRLSHRSAQTDSTANIVAKGMGPPLALPVVAKIGYSVRPM